MCVNIAEKGFGENCFSSVLRAVTQGEVNGGGVAQDL